MNVQPGAKATDIGKSQKDVKAQTADPTAKRAPGRAKGMAVELRRLRGNVTLPEWESFALAAFDLIVMINEEEDPATW